MYSSKASPVSSTKSTRTLVSFGFTFLLRLYTGRNTGSIPEVVLGHQTGCAGRSDGQARNVTATIFFHILIQCRVGFAQAVDKRIVLFSFRVIYIDAPRSLAISTDGNDKHPERLLCALSLKTLSLLLFHNAFRERQAYRLRL